MLGRILLLLGLPLLASPALALTIYKYTDANGVVTYSDRPRPVRRCSSSATAWWKSSTLR